MGEILGVNDQNLKILENILGIKIFTQGNEIILDTDDEQIYTIFKKMLNQMEDYVRQGQTPGSQIIHTIYNSLNTGETEKLNFLKKKQIFLPVFLKSVFPRSYNQAVYLDYIENYELIFSIGPAGTGKTFLAVAHALKSILGHDKRKLIITRPVVEADESLGFLPGDLEQKIKPYLRPIYDSIESIIPAELFKRLLDNGTIEIAPLAYMRGRTFADSIIILDEAQNTTKKQMFMFLTRMGENSKCIITGDITQTDLPKNIKSGLIHASSVLKEIDEIKFVFFAKKDIVRSPLVKKIIQAYEEKL